MTKERAPEGVESILEEILAHCRELALRIADPQYTPEELIESKKILALNLRILEIARMAFIDPNDSLPN